MKVIYKGLFETIDEILETARQNNKRVSQIILDEEEWQELCEKFREKHGAPVGKARWINYEGVLLVRGEDEKAV